MERTAMKALKAWKDGPGRKPLMITGCRQCGKTWLMTEFGRRYFDRTLLFNFEKEPALADIFRYDLNPDRILGELGLLREGRPIDTARTLIIFDEIQQCPEAVTSLKYFAEDRRDICLICAGSLLGVELKRKNVSFPVGKNEQLKLYPLSFFEFVQALGGGQYLELIDTFERDREIPAYIAEPMLRYLRLYYAIGGMPEAVQTYIDTEDMQRVDEVLDRIIRDLRNDFSHHADARDVLRIGWIWDSVPKQLARENGKFVFSHVKSGARARDLEDALTWLVDAGLVYRLEKVSRPQMPLSACADSTFFKVYVNDTGLLRRIAGLAWRTVLGQPEDYTPFKGAFVENYCMTELVNLGIRPYYWRSDNTAEVDFLFEDDMNRIIPLETKSADNTRAKSFTLYCRQYAPHRGFRVSTRNVGINLKDRTQEISLPLYLLWRIGEYLGE